MNEFIFKKYSKASFSWNVQILDKNEYMNNDIFPIKTKALQIKQFLYYAKLYENEKWVQCTPLDYLQNIIDGGYATYANLKKTNYMKPILKYSFKETKALLFYNILVKLQIPNSTSTLSFSKGDAIMDALNYYKISNNHQSVLDTYYFYDVIQYKDKFKNFYEKISDNHYSIFTNECYFNNEWIDEQHLQSYDLIIIDYWIWIWRDPLNYIRNCHMFKSVLPFIILSLKHLKIGGTLILYTLHTTNRAMFQLILYIASYFTETKTDNLDIALADTNYFDTEFIIFTGYDGKINLDKLKELNHQLFNLDPKLFNSIPKDSDIYIVDDTKLIKEFNIKNIGTGSPKGYIVSLFDDRMFLKQYKKYRKYVKININALTSRYHDTHHMFINRNKPKLIKKLCKQNKISAIMYAHIYKLPIATWIRESPTKYMKKYIDIVVNKKYITVNKLKSDKTTIELKKTSVVDNAMIYITQYKIYEKTYNYMLNNHKKQYAKIIHRISDNSSTINELIDNTQFINYTFSGAGLYICTETNALIDAIKNKYCAINVWDTVVFKNNILNLNDYKKQYMSYDIFIGNCSDDDHTYDKNVGVMQLYGVLFFVKKGGNFIIKTSISKQTQLFVSLLYIIHNFWESVYVANICFWSSEFYIVGVNRLHGDVDNQQILIDSSRSLNDSSPIIYPIDNISDKFTTEYTTILNKYISQTSSFHNFFLFLINHPKYIKKI